MSASMQLYVGCYTTASRIGIHVFEVDDDGVTSAVGGVDHLEHPSFLAVSPATATMYAVSERADAGALVAMRIEDGTLTKIDEVPSHGGAPCHVSTDGTHVYVANYASGTIAAYALRPDGRFGELLGRHRHEGSGPHPRQEAPHAHCIVPGPDGTSVYAVDLGTDRIVRYVHSVRDGAARLVPADETVTAPGSGPRHLAFHPTQPVAFALCELDCTLVVLDVDLETGRLQPRAVVPTLPDDAEGASIAAEVRVHPDGHRVYVSNRGHDSIATFAFDTSDTAPELVGHVSSGGRTPRHFAIHPSGHLLFAANQDSDNVVAFALDDATGLPRRIGVAAEVSRPVCVLVAGIDR